MSDRERHAGIGGCGTCLLDYSSACCRADEARVVEELTVSALDHFECLHAFVDAGAMFGALGVLELRRRRELEKAPAPQTSLHSHIEVAIRKWRQPATTK